MRTRFARFGALILLLAMLAGCAAQPPTTKPETTKPDAAPAGASKPEAAKPAAGPAKEELVVGLGAQPTTLDTGMATGVDSQQIGLIHFDSLVTVDKDLALKPGLALSWDAVNPTTWQFKLRPNVKFHNGEPFDANVVKYSIERVLNPDNKSLWLGQMAGTKSVEIVDPATANVTTAGPMPVLPALLTRIPMVPPKYVQEVGIPSFGTKPVGSGPFKFVEWKKDDRITFEANAEYWGGAPKLKRIVFKPIPEDSSRVAALKSGAIDIAVNLPPDEIDSVKGLPDLTVAPVRSLSMMMVGFDTRTPPFKDKRVRQALNYAVDKEALVKAILKAEPDTVLKGQMLSPSWFGFNPDLKAYPYDPEKAKQLLAEAGFPNGFETKLTTPAGYYTKDKELSEAISGQLAKVGVRASVAPMEYGAWLKNLIAKTDSPMWFQGWRWPPDADLMFRTFYGSGSLNFTSYANPAFEEAVKRGSSALDPQERLKAYKQATEIMRDDPPVVFLHEQVMVYGLGKKVQGFQPLGDERLLLAPVSFGQ